eukprot:COSAG01_NODE_3481_length_6029_cov_3.062785_1_plen_68_part_00
MILNLFVLLMSFFSCDWILLTFLIGRLQAGWGCFKEAGARWLLAAGCCCYGPGSHIKCDPSIIQDDY